MKFFYNIGNCMKKSAISLDQKKKSFLSSKILNLFCNCTFVLFIVINLLLVSRCFYYKYAIDERKKEVTGCLDEKSVVKIVQILVENEHGLLIDKEFFDVNYKEFYNHYNVNLKKLIKIGHKGGVLDYDYDGYYINKDTCRIVFAGIEKDDILKFQEEYGEELK